MTFATQPAWTVEIRREGRGGRVTYTDGPHQIELDSELGGGDAIFVVTGPRPQDWATDHPWVGKRRWQVMTRVGVAVQMQEFPRATFSFGDEYSTIVFPHRRSVRTPRHDRFVETLTSALELPIRIRRGDASPRDLAAASGFATIRGEFTVERLCSYLNEHATLVDAWAEWSQDKRVTEGWYFVKGRVLSRVGWYGARGEHRTQHYFSVTTACAHFALRELDLLTDIAAP